MSVNDHKSTDLIRFLVTINCLEIVSVCYEILGLSCVTSLTTNIDKLTNSIAETIFIISLFNIKRDKYIFKIK